MKQTLRFEQLSCRLQVEGLPDVSVGQGGEAIGIITGWSLRWAGRPELEGRKEHLLALMQVVLPYARHLISGVRRRFGGDGLPVEIGPGDGGESAGAAHTLLLRSSQPDTPPLTIGLDDAELADLVRVLDQLRLDPRLQLLLDLPEPQPLKPREVQGRLPRRQRLAAPVGGAVALALAAGVSLLLPEPKPRPQPATTPPEATLSPPAEPTATP